jgi:hypothetical protein
MAAAPVLLLQDLHVRVMNAATGELLPSDDLPAKCCELLSLAEQYARLGAGEVIIMLLTEQPLGRAEELARLLPRLHSIG